MIRQSGVATQVYSPIKIPDSALRAVVHFSAGPTET